MPPLTGDGVAVGPDFAAPGLGDVVADIGGERGLAHAGTAGEDDQVGRLQAAHHAVEVVEAGGDARQFAVALVGVRGHVDGGGERLGEALEAAVVAAGFGQFVKPALGVLDLGGGRIVDRRVEGDIDQVLADDDQRAADRQVIDGAAVVVGIDDGGGFGGEPRQVLAHRHAADIDIAVEEGLQRHRRGDLAGADQVARQLIDLLMDRLEEMLGVRGNRRRGRRPRC